MTMLVLLVGTNPLPNYVVARYLLMNSDAPDSILLVHTGETSVVATRIEDAINTIARGQAPPITRLPLSSNAALDGDQLYHEVLAHMETVSGDMHLNYTGGRKPMAVHAYRAAENLDSGVPLFSYLNPQSFQLRYDGGNFAPRTGDMRHEVTLDLVTLLKLHGCTFVSEEQREYHRTADWLLTLACKKPKRKEGAAPPHFEDFRTWKTRLRPERGKWAGVTINTPPWPTTENGAGFEPLASAIQQDFNLPSSCTWNSLDDDQRTTIGEFLDGKWLEQVVAKKLSQYVNDASYLSPPITSCHRNVKAMREPRDERASRYAPELDVVVMRGYELVLLSCTTAGYGQWEYNRDIIKSKAFEALHRATQFGGEEAQAVLVTPCEPEMARRLMEDLENDFAAGRPKLSILDRTHLNGFAHAFKAAINPRP